MNISSLVEKNTRGLGMRGKNGGNNSNRPLAPAAWEPELGEA